MDCRTGGIGVYYTRSRAEGDDTLTGKISGFAVYQKYGVETGILDVFTHDPLIL